MGESFIVTGRSTFDWLAVYNHDYPLEDLDKQLSLGLLRQPLGPLIFYMITVSARGSLRLHDK